MTCVWVNKSGRNNDATQKTGFRTILTGTNFNNLINYFRNKYGL